MSLLNQYLSGIGVDVSDHHLRVAQVNLFGSIQKLIEIDLPEGLVVDEKVVKPEELKALLQNELKRLDFVDAGVATTVLIPESRVFGHTVLLESTLRGEELRIRARDAAQRDIPVPFAQAQVCVSEGSKEAGQVRETVYAVEKSVFDPLVSTFHVSSLRLVAMEANSKALLRLLQRFGGSEFHTGVSETLIGIVDIGHSWTTISLYTRKGSNVFSRTIPHRITETIDLKNPLLSDRVVDMVVGTIQEVMLFFEGQQMKIGHMIFAGVEAHDDRLKEKIAVQQKTLPVLLIGEAVKLTGVNKKQIHTFGAAIGAALRSIFPRRYGYQHNFLTKT